MENDVKEMEAEFEVFDKRLYDPRRSLLCDSLLCVERKCAVN